MRTMVKLRWLVLALWLAAIVGLVMSAPNMADLVREKGQIRVPDSYASMNRGDERQAVRRIVGCGDRACVPYDNPLTDSELADIRHGVVQSSEKGLQKTEWITVVFILAILFVVFRSAIAPFIPLLTVGISYVESQSPAV